MTGSKTEKTSWEINWASDRLKNYLQRHSLDLPQSDLEKIQRLQIKLKCYVFEIAVLGLASCGKSSLLNALQGKNNWLTSPLHGTTRDQAVDELEPDLDLEAITEGANSQKVQIKLIDTPGLDEVSGEARAEIAINASNQADLIFFVTAGDLTRLELEMISQLKQAYKPIFLIFNKTDLYPQSDRQLIHAALQDQELQNLISPQDIIFTSAKPLPRRVRLEYADNSQEIWENLTPDIKALKEKILEILNQDGRALLAINTMRSLLEIHINLMQSRLDKILPERTIASGLFVVKAIATVISPISILDFMISTLIDSSLIGGAIGLLGYTQLGKGIALSVINSLILVSIPNQLGQIAWLGVATPWLVDWLKQDLQKAHALKQFIKELRRKCSPDSILHRLKFKF